MSLTTPQTDSTIGLCPANRWRILLVVIATLLLISTSMSFPQKKKEGLAVAPSPPPLKRTTTKHESRRFGYGGTVTIYGAPHGSISIEGSRHNEVDVNADIELQAHTEEDLARLALLNNFTMDRDVNHVFIYTLGTHDAKYMKRVAKNFPKNLLGLPWKIDYRLRVPALTDLEIFTGSGTLNVTGVEGALHITAGQTNATLVLTGGDTEARFLSGQVMVRLAASSWRGRGVNIMLNQGELTVELPANFNGDIDAEVLQNGRIETTHAGLTPRDEDVKPTARAQQLRAGGGGATLTFKVSDGILRIKQENKEQKAGLRR